MEWALSLAMRAAQAARSAASTAAADGDEDTGAADVVARGEKGEAGGALSSGGSS